MNVTPVNHSTNFSATPKLKMGEKLLEITPENVRSMFRHSGLSSDEMKSLPQALVEFSDAVKKLPETFKLVIEKCEGKGSKKAAIALTYNKGKGDSTVTMMAGDDLASRMLKMIDVFV